MGHNIPTFFFPVNTTVLKDIDVTEDFVQHYLGEKFESRHEEGIREVTSRNWWYQDTVLELVKRLNISGLEFLSDELIILDKTRLSKANASLDQLISKISDSIPVFSDQEHEEHIGIIKLSREDVLFAFQKANPDFVINPPVDSGFEAVVGFYSFLKSMHAAINNALERDLLLVYYRSQP